MFSSRNYAVFLALSCIFLIGTGISFTLDRDFGDVDVEKVSITDGTLRISGLLYRPQVATSENLLPAVVLAHGISGAKEALSDIALELSRHGFVALAVDLVGHGGSEGQLGSSNDSTIGILAAVRYLESQDFVHVSFIGLVGHSLGAGAIRAMAVAHGNIFASVFIGGGIGGMVAGPAYGTLNSTFPKNLLIAVGKYDVLFNLTQLQTELLPPIFGTSQEVEAGLLYGSFDSETARKLVTPATTHLFEPVDPTVVSETVEWMTNALIPQSSGQSQPYGKDLIYPYREITALVNLFTFIGLIFPISAVVLDRYYSPTMEKKELKKTSKSMEDWKVLVILGGLGLVLFLFMVPVGLFLNFPPLIFGSSIAWWLLATGAAELLVLWLLSKFSSLNLKLKEVVHRSFDRQALVITALLLVLLYLIIILQ